MGMEEKYIQQFKKGAYEMILLSLIAQKETYGYEILTEIQKQGGEIFAFAKEGTIYLVPSDKGRTYPVPPGAGESKRGRKKILFAYRRGKRYARKNEKFLGKLQGLCGWIYERGCVI